MLYFKHPTTGEVFAFDTADERAQFGTPELVPLTPAEVDAHLNPPRSPAQIRAEIAAAVQQRLDAFARTRDYDGILSATTYANSAVARFAAESQYALAARDATWARVYEILAEVQAGTRPAPQSFADVEAELPSLAWPQ